MSSIFAVGLESSVAHAGAILTIDELTWDASSGQASVSGDFSLTSYTGSQWRLVGLEIQVNSQVATTSLAPYPTYSSYPFTYEFEDIILYPSSPLVVGSSQGVGIRMQRYFDFLGAFETGHTVFRGAGIVEAIPEPSTALMLSLGLLCMAAVRR
ncbi:PEP-CTERM sorting domain-containing protein [Myxococcota bacterium]|nr:PEP-CTERM sorting domain-containing protein [Myxococcota bacterium]